MITSGDTSDTSIFTSETSEITDNKNHGIREILNFTGKIGVP